ncbi:uncharacterized protein LOC143224099 isoform X1 [Tachypleus tridentatus]|uniref:uncharacterized protein LOC143224099 isoform X1 n=2 Tax=Tachypleus tridentatus TaxID=6853 RepID=UPI003FD2D2D2
MSFKLIIIVADNNCNFVTVFSCSRNLDLYILGWLQATGFEDKFKPPPGRWLCSTCMINNKSSVSRCAACETPKPESLIQASKATVSGFSDKLKSSAGSWECYTCLIRNKPDSLRCVACETPQASDVNAKGA